MFDTLLRNVRDTHTYIGGRSKQKGRAESCQSDYCAPTVCSSKKNEGQDEVQRDFAHGRARYAYIVLRLVRRDNHVGTSPVSWLLLKSLRWRKQKIWWVLQYCWRKVIIHDSEIDQSGQWWWNFSSEVILSQSPSRGKGWWECMWSYCLRRDLTRGWGWPE